MVLPNGTRNFTIEVKYYLSCYRAWEDADRAIQTLRGQKISYTDWRVQWAGICAIMKSSVHVMLVDAKRCFSTELRDSLKARFRLLGEHKSSYPIFWQFIDRERHNILKEYQFSAYAEAIADPDNDGKDLPTLFSSMMAERELRLKGGLYDGRLALDVADEASQWLKDYLEETVRLGGFMPDERIQSDGFLWHRVPKADLAATAPWWAAPDDALGDAGPETHEHPVKPPQPE
ncbi:hypothetical protein [Devosia psychrophila]|uniref:Uncharacterized protein n=1 Tax=Devosia psychrophila TaxID=728005 RepID=A0A0F5Q2X8_9HYPH|nr:hypothetical protein [Devosia psychrophila]KKC34434.1 hypothetical protein WH91_02635 [Devosia psychrophila]SFD03066.1 hypothetical protein SAMN04488059_11812 [Devosia psychrophila]